MKSAIPDEKPEKGKKDGDRRRRDGQRGKDGQRNRDGQRRNSGRNNMDKPEMKRAVNPRKRIVPKADPAPVENPEVEANTPAETTEAE